MGRLMGREVGATSDRGSFDFTSRDKTARRFAQDDNFFSTAEMMVRR
jgi:hypothetical protein